MRLIYVDEAGTSANEPISVVVGVIVQADDQYRSLVNALSSVIESGVPSIYRDEFIFHAKEVFSGGKSISREVWAFDDRLDFYKEVLSLIYIHDVPVVMALSKRNGYDPDIYALVAPKIKPHQFDHITAFAKCLERADLFIRKYLNNTETGAVIAEDVTELRGQLAKHGLRYRDSPLTIGPEGLVPNAYQKAFGIMPEAYTHRIDNIIDCPHFVSKAQAPIMQLADACAFAIRRWLCEQNHGVDLMFAMLGPEGAPIISDRVWIEAASSSGIFNTRAYWK